MKGYGSASRKKSTAEVGVTGPKGANSLERETNPKITVTRIHLTMMDNKTAERCGAKSGDSRRTDLASSPANQGSPKRSGGTLPSCCGTRVGDARLRTTGTIKLLQWNAEGIQHKKIALSKFLQDEKIDIACIQETHLTENIRCSIRGYQHFRKDRKERHKGGVIIFVRNDIATNEITTDDSVEILAVKITKNKLQYTIYNCYSPPSENLPIENIRTEEEQFIAVGDFNSHSPSWGYNDLDRKGETLENWLTDSKLQIVRNEDDPDTYFSRAWKTTSTPDLTLVSEDLTGKVNKQVKEQLAGSDHRPILVEITEDCAKDRKAPPPRWNYKKADWTLFSKLTDSLTKEINCKTRNVEKSAKAFTKSIMKAAKESIPRGSRKEYCPGWTEKLGSLNNQVTEHRKKAEREPNDENMKIYKEAEATLRKETIEAKQEAWHEKTRQLDYDRDGRKLWNLTKALSGQENRYAAPSVEDDQGKILNKKQAANCFMKRYSSVGNIQIEKERKREVCKELRKHKDTPKESTDDAMFSSIKKEEVEIALKSLKMNKSPGPDEVTNDMLKHLGTLTKKKMKQLFNASWKQGKLPLKWKQAIMIPIKKEGKPKNKPESYRPISLTSCLGKLMERIVNRRLQWYLESNKLISDEQAGFRQLRCTEDQITYISQLIENGYQEKKHTVTVWVDMEKAFDKVWTKGLLLKLKKANVSHNMFAWIKDYLTNRKARVQSQNSKSKLTNMTNGVPQGGVLSPTLFVVFINDIYETKCRGVKAAMYADDLALICTEGNIGTAKARIQMTLDALSKWTKDWGMRVNADKTTYTTFSLSTKKQSIQLTLDGKILREDLVPRYLGVKFDPRLTWKHQIDESQQKGYKRMQLLRKLAGTQWGANSNVLKKTYLGYVRPAMDYAISAWGTCSQAQFQKVEKVQNQCLRVITGAMKTTPINKMETHTGIKPLKNQRNLKIMTQFSKIKFMESQPLHPSTKKKKESRLKRENFIAMGQKLESKYEVTPKEDIAKINVPNAKPPPWKKKQKFIMINKKNIGSNNDHAQTLMMIDKKYPMTNWIRVYTDGSVSGPLMNGGAGALIHWSDKTETKISVPVGSLSTSTKAEEIAILDATKELSRDYRIYGKNVVFLTDSDDALRAIENSQDSEAAHTVEALEGLSAKTGKIVLQWIPSHIGIYGNETADQLAKEGAQMEQPKSSITYHQQKKIIKLKMDKEWNDTHLEHNKQDPIHAIQRSSQVTLFRLRTGHNRLRGHMFTKLGIGTTPYCPCGTDHETTSHVLMDCPLYNVQRSNHWVTPATLNTKLYGEAEDLKRTTDFIADIGLQP